MVGLQPKERNPINEINKASGCDRCDGPGGAKTFANQVCMPINSKVQCIEMRLMN